MTAVCTTKTVPQIPQCEAQLDETFGAEPVCTIADKHFSFCLIEMKSVTRTIQV
jgi:hypothetical protein